jgi:hypothetical protein
MRAGLPWVVLLSSTAATSGAKAELSDRFRYKAPLILVQADRVAAGIVPEQRELHRLPPERPGYAIATFLHFVGGFVQYVPASGNAPLSTHHGYTTGTSRPALTAGSPSAHAFASSSDAA